MCKIQRSYSSSAPVPLRDPSWFIYEKPIPYGCRGTENGPKENPPRQYKYEALLSFRSDKGGSLPEDPPWAQGAMRPRAPSSLQVSHSHLLGSPVNSVNDLRSVSQLLSLCWGPKASTPHEGVREQEARNKGQHHLGMVCPLSFLGNGFLGSARKFELMENGRPSLLQSKSLWSPAYCFSVFLALSLTLMLSF